MKRLACLCQIVLVLGVAPLYASSLKPDEAIIYFPTDASWHQESGKWQVPLHGWIFEAEKDSLWRQGAMELLKQQLGLQQNSNHAQHLKQRGWPFLVDNERGKKITISIAGETLSLSPSQANGHFTGSVQLEGENEALLSSRWLHYETLMPDGDNRRFSGTAQLVPPEGLSIISDIDDTIKHSHVLNKEELLANTFLRDFSAIPGMAERYRQWEKRGATFHYITGSPWQLYPALQDFIIDEGFPRGSFTMRDFRLKDSTLLDFLSSSEGYKISAIDSLFLRYPGRHFILVGDSGEKDPEVYGVIARRYPEKVSAIFIHNVTGESRDDARFLRAFEGIPRQRWSLFDDGNTLTIQADFNRN